VASATAYESGNQKGLRLAASKGIAMRRRASDAAAALLQVCLLIAGDAFLRIAPEESSPLQIRSYWIALTLLTG
jgi:hypothetical protein